STSPPPSQLPSASRREDRPEVTLPPRKRLCIGFGTRDRRAHAHTRLLMEAEARMSREAWTRAIDACNLVHGEVISLRTTVLGQIPEIRELQAADRRRQTDMIDQGVTAALAARDALRSTNGDDSHNSGTGVRRTERAARECTYT
nr:hypothetical protein [Tanacetum cinerariifolium]